MITVPVAKEQLSSGMAEAYGIDLQAKNEILDYQDWIKEVQATLKRVFDLPATSPFLQPFEDDESGLKSWKTMFNQGTNASAMAYFIFTASD